MNVSRELLASLALALATLPAFACTNINTPIYLGPPEPMALLELTGMEKNPRITNSVTLEYRKPSDDEQKQLDAQGAALKAADDPLHRDVAVPWASSDKIHLEVLFTVRNLDTEAGTFDVVIDGANQYTKYDENVVAAALGQGKNDAPVYLPLVNLHPLLPMMLGPGESYSGVIREDDFAEAEKDLDALGRWMAPFAQVLVNRSEIEATLPAPNGLETIPARVVTPALVEVDLTLTATKHMTCEWLVRVRDEEDRLWHATGDPHFNPHPTLFEPMLPSKTP
jgi:hypothetical protein